MLPVFLPAEFLEPGEALFEAGNVQNRRDILHVHTDQCSAGPRFHRLKFVETTVPRLEGTAGRNDNGCEREASGHDVSLERLVFRCQALSTQSTPEGGCVSQEPGGR